MHFGGSKSDKRRVRGCGIGEFLTRRVVRLANPASWSWPPAARLPDILDE
jgi:hypothetical protein